MNWRLCVCAMAAVSCGPQQSVRPPVPSSGTRPESSWSKLARGPIPGFAGISGLSYPQSPDGNGRMCVVHIALTDTTRANRRRAESFFATGDIGSPYPPASCTGQRAFRFAKVKYDFAQLEEWQTALMSNPSAVSVPTAPRMRMTTITVRNNMLEVHTSDSVSRAKLVARALDVGIPADAITIDTTFPARPPEFAGLLNPSGNQPAVYFEFQVDKPAGMLPGELERIKGIHAKALGTAGETSVQFVVDTEGVPDISTFKVLNASDDNHSFFLRQMIPFVKYTPAKREGKVVAQLVHVTFRFDITR